MCQSLLQDVILSMACHAPQPSPTVTAALTSCCLDRSVPLTSTTAMLGLLIQRAASCPPAAFLGLVAALFGGSAALRMHLEAAAHDPGFHQPSDALVRLWDHHKAVCAAGASALQRVHDKGGPVLLFLTSMHSCFCVLQARASDGQVPGAGHARMPDCQPEVVGHGHELLRLSSYWTSELSEQQAESCVACRSGRAAPVGQPADR